jgi:hypothetical protein
MRTIQVMYKNQITSHTVDPDREKRIIDVLKAVFPADPDLSESTFVLVLHEPADLFPGYSVASDPVETDDKVYVIFNLPIYRCV